MQLKQQELFMARKARLVWQNATYHITSRCAGKKPLMKSPEMKEIFIHAIQKTQKKYKFQVIQYVIMDNHFHLIIKTLKDGDTISIIMQFLKSQYARMYHKANDTCGPFWNERFKDKIIEDQDNPVAAFHNINNYIMYNPVKADYVSNPREYKYGCIHFYLDEDYNSPVKLTTHKYFLRLGKKFNTRTKKFIKLKIDTERNILFNFKSKESYNNFRY